MKMNKVNSRQEKSAFAVKAGEKDRSCGQCKGYKARTAYPTITRRKENNTGLPDNLKTGIESLSGIGMDDVKVHYNSSKPVGLNALAYARGNEIHVAAGQETYLPHEAWHVVQQKQGRVKQTIHTKGVAVNDDKDLEKEADVMGAKASNVVTNRSEKNQGKTAGDTVSATSSLIQRKPGEFTNVDWSTATKAAPTEEGAVGGVMRITIGPKIYILKAVTSGGGTKFGEKILEKVGGAVSTESVLVPNGSEEAREIIEVLNRFKDNETDDKLKPRWIKNLPFFEKAPYIALQKNMFEVGGQEMEKVVHSNQVASILDQTLLRNLGKALAADTLIGNSDRFENMNTGNAFVINRDQIGAIDTATILQNYEQYLGMPDRPTLGSDPVYDWITFITEQGAELGGIASSSSIGLILTNFDRWFNNSFRYSIEKKIKEFNVPIELNEELWKSVKSEIEAGLEMGLKQIDLLLSGNEYKNLKKDFKDLESRYGTNPNYDWRAFKARRAYIITLRQGGKPEDAQKNALSVANYMLRWKPQVRSLLKTGNLDKLHPPARPVELSKKEKATRFISGIGGINKPLDEKLAKEIKNKARKLEVSNEDLDKVSAMDITNRRAQKSLYETVFALFIKEMNERAAGLEDLSKENKEALLAVNSNGPAAELARKKIDFIRKIVMSEEIRQLFNKYENIYREWLESADTIRDTKEKVSKKELLQVAYKALTSALHT